ncbi:MAG: hypothetical protein H7A51_15120 [Akkermansiaceae bacterium]|nr:hypothetical protein [Akkermansiaceae bacterium]
MPTLTKETAYGTNKCGYDYFLAGSAEYSSPSGSLTHDLPAFGLIICVAGEAGGGRCGGRSSIDTAHKRGGSLGGVIL